MKETGIIMSGDHPQKIIDLLKTQTRRTWGLERINLRPNDWYLEQSDKLVMCNRETGERLPVNDPVIGGKPYGLVCPYGQVSDRLVIKETWATENRYNHLKPSEVPRTAKIWYLSDEQYDPFIMGIVRSAMFMCLWMSRVKPEITEVRAERVQKITEGDAKAEGANPFLLDKLKGGTKYRMLQTYHHEAYPLISHADKGEIVVFECPNMGFARLHHTQWQEGKEPVFRIPVKEVFSFVGALEPDYRNGFRILWDSFNAKRGYGWDFNPWVWPISFKGMN